MTSLCSSTPPRDLNLVRFGQAAQARLFTGLNIAHTGFGDLRMTAIALIAAVLTAAGRAWLQTIAARALQGAHFARRLPTADTMVATGRRRRGELAP